MEKRNITYAFLLVLMTLAISCKKDTEVNKDTFKIEREEVAATTQSVRITGTYAYSGTIDGITLELGRQADLMDSDAYRTLLEGTDFSVEVKNLRTNVTYYYRYAVEYGGKSPYRTEIKSFKTEEYNLPNVESKEVVSVGVNRAEVSGEVKSDGGGDAVTLRGICWSMSHNPSVGDEYANAGEGIGTFTCELTNLQPEKTYYARAFAGNSKGVSYGAELTFVTLAAGSLAEVRTLGISGNAMLQATVSGEVIMEGTSAVLERGICYGKEHYPTTSGLHVSSGAGAGEFICQLTNLDANATYYVRAYAVNSLGIAYGEEMSFVAMTEMTVPVVETGLVNDITESSATGRGMVISDGGATVTRRGLCWSMEPDPTIYDIYADCGSGIGEFSCLMPHLETLATYYVRAYAENAIGIAYGDMVSFTVGQHWHPEVPVVTTSEVMDISTTTAVGGGNVVDDGGATVTERGICWSTSPDPTTEDMHASNGAGIGAYTCMMTGLELNTTYYVRAYAINEIGTAYGEETQFTTEANLPTISQLYIDGAMVAYTIDDDGGASVTEHGVCWGTTPDPTISGTHISGGSGMGEFFVELTGLLPSTTYYVRVYAVNSVGIAYSEVLTFSTSAILPTVTTSQVTDITQTTAIGGGNVTDDGGATVTERGICWSTSQNPTPNDNYASSGAGIGDFTVEMTDLTPSTLYYVRAYAVNEIGISYGLEVNFTTTDVGGWLYYDDGIYATSIGAPSNGVIYWATMFPATALAPYAGTNLTKVALYENSYNTEQVTVSIYLGGDSAPQTMMSTMNYNPVGGEAFHEVALTTSVAVDGTQNLWIVFTENGTYPANACADTGDPNNRWVSLDGSDWMDVASAGVPGYGWMIRGYVTSERGDTMELKPIANKPHAPANGKTINLNTMKKTKQ